MSKQNSKLDCFDVLDTNRNFIAELSWLNQLSGKVDTVVEFGCHSYEPFALLWILNASRVEIIEKSERNLIIPKFTMEFLQVSRPDCIKNGQIIIHQPQDITTADLPSEIFDLAYCKRVLSNMKPDEKILRAVKNMARVIKRGGYLIAVERMNDKEGRTRPSDFLSSYLSEVGLQDQVLHNSPRDAYCFRKPMMNA